MSCVLYLLIEKPILTGYTEIKNPDLQEYPVKQRQHFAGISAERQPFAGRLKI
jgi:hypothetical protein